MTPERWRRVRELLEAALALSPGEQSEFLAKATADDEGLRREVESLLALEEEANRLLPSGAPLAGSRVVEETAALPQSLGAYRIVGEAGHGGMGVVYRAERVDGQYTKQVAIKLLPTLYSLTELATRFLRERQILARLEHPNVARLLDGGVAPDGRPYLVMEYVDGQPITGYATDQGLNVADRLRLFLDLCEAVEYAHRNFIVHRDLKPANILVDRDGRVKLLDFGLARILDTASPHSDVTQTALPMMTPAYASPEQIRGEPITAASDVFSLGVVLYELLAGRRPFGEPGQTAAQVQRAVCETDPPAPGKGPDLDNVVLKAIAKDAPERYPSVEAFAQDLRFYLEGRPVSARRASLAYRARKFVGRNRVPVALAALALIGTVTGLVAALRASRAAQIERARAERRFNDVRKLANSFLFEFHDAIANLKGATPARALVIKRAREYLSSLSQDAQGDPGLLRELARSYVLLGDILGEMSFANLGDTKGSIESYQQAEALSRALVAANPKDPLNRRGLMVVQQRMAMAYMKTGHPEEALRVLEPAGKTADELAAVAHPGEQVFVDLFIQYERLGMAYEKLGETAKHIENNRKLLDVALRLKQMNPQKDRWIRSLMLAYNHLAVALGTSQEASDLYRKAHEIAAARAAANPDDGEAQTDLGIADVFEAGYRTKTGALDEAFSLAQSAQVRLAKMAAADPENLEAAKEASDAWFALGEVYLKRGKTADAARAFEESARLLEPGAAKDAMDLELRASLASSYFGAGESREKLRGCPDALPWYRKSSDQWSTLTKQQALSPMYRPAAARAEEAAQRCAKPL
jgi:tetratricopeptide (TPR) repeat protein